MCQVYSSLLGGVLGWVEAIIFRKPLQLSFCIHLTLFQVPEGQIIIIKQYPYKEFFNSVYLLSVSTPTMLALYGGKFKRGGQAGR